MIFNSVTFILFLSVTVGLYWLLPRQARLWMLLMASCVFYGFWRWEYLTIMFISAMTDYFTATAIGNTPIENKLRRNTLLSITLIVNLGLLAYFKYLYFFSTNVNSVISWLGYDHLLPVYKVLLPFGISFYTFETISYTVDVYRGIIKPERSFLNYTLFVVFFPKLVAGPIQRASELMVQLKSRPDFKLDFISSGLKRILYGIFLKVVLADNISPIVDECFDLNPSGVSAIDVWTMAFLFGFQIYFDFSAYSHIALGSARLMGIDVPENFNFPYIATSFKDFWKRWHISLSSWIRDYLYLPLSGEKVRKSTGKGGIGEGLETTANAKRNRSLFVTWAIMGLWHGANWTFVLWGLYHAFFVFLERKLSPLRRQYAFLSKWWITWPVTLGLAMLSWIPFRAGNMENALSMLSKVVNPFQYGSMTLRENTYLVTGLVFAVVLIAWFADEFIEVRLKKWTVPYFVLNCVRYTVIIVLSFTFFRPISQFIYFQF